MDKYSLKQHELKLKRKQLILRLDNQKKYKNKS